MKAALLCTALAASAATAWAGRPLATDDAGTAPAGTCQLEAWVDRTSDAHEVVVAPACGVADDVELGLDVTRRSPAGDARIGAGIAAKWVPPRLQGLETSLGTWHFGLKAAAAADRASGGDWTSPTVALAGLATLEVSDAWAVHANLGAVRDREAGADAAFANLALSWAPQERWLLFAEVLGNDRREAFGGTVRNAGVRWWAVPERFGIDLVAGREAGTSGTRWSVGFGWYGLFE